MNSPVQYLLLVVAELGSRVDQLEHMVSTLKGELECVTNRPIPVPVPVKVQQAMNTSVPLMHQGKFHHGSGTHRSRDSINQRVHRSHKDSLSDEMGSGHAAASAAAAAGGYAKPSKRDHKQLTIQDVLHGNEEVTIRVNKGKDEQGALQQTTCVTRFDGANLIVESCELVPSLVGMISSKPGEILYRFIEELKSNGHIERAFSTAPWKLCFVERDGKSVSLEQLRTAPPRSA